MPGVKKLATNIVCSALVACLTAGGAAVPARPQVAEAATAKAPAYNARLSQKNMLRLVRAYDSDAFYILKAQNKAGDSFATWMRGSKRLVDAVDTTVHEEFHAFTIERGGYAFSQGAYRPYELYYLGGKKTRKVARTKVFPTYKAARKIPKRYRTFRYDTYVTKDSNASANKLGVYGMLNEFSAYYWGMRASESLYPYIRKHAANADGYLHFVSDFMNDRDAYAEFYYWTLVYLDYARVHKHAVYKQILANKSYVKTFTGTRKKYERLVRSYREGLDRVCKRFNHGAGFSKSYNKKSGTLRLGNKVWMWPGASYQTLAGQLSSGKYAKVRKALAGAS